MASFSAPRMAPAQQFRAVQNIPLQIVSVFLFLFITNIAWAYDSVVDKLVNSSAESTYIDGTTLAGKAAIRFLDNEKLRIAEQNVPLESLQEEYAQATAYSLLMGECLKESSPQKSDRRLGNAQIFHALTIALSDGQSAALLLRKEYAKMQPLTNGCTNFDALLDEYSAPVNSKMEGLIAVYNAEQEREQGPTAALQKNAEKYGELAMFAGTIVGALLIAIFIIVRGRKLSASGLVQAKGIGGWLLFFIIGFAVLTGFNVISRIFQYQPVIKYHPELTSIIQIYLGAWVLYSAFCFYCSWLMLRLRKKALKRCSIMLILSIIFAIVAPLVVLMAIMYPPENMTASLISRALAPEDPYILIISCLFYALFFIYLKFSPRVKNTWESNKIVKTQA